MSATLEIRLANSEEASSISEVLLQSFIEYKSEYTPDGFAATTPGVEEVKHRLTEGPVWVALLKGTVVGTVSLSRAIALYERLGFVRTDAGPHDLYGTPLFTMEKMLAGSDHLLNPGDR